MINIKIEDILNKEMSRTEFLGLIGAGILSMVGVTALLKNASEIFGKSSPQKSGMLQYGSDVYGGTKPKDSII